MLLVRLPVLFLLLALLLGPGSRAERAERVGLGALGGLGGRYPRARMEPDVSGFGARGLEREGRSHPGPVGNPRDPRHKEKFIKHLTGPLYFNPKCKKHFHRLYHNTRDCTIPAFYKRCARLLTRLANSPRCTER